MTKYCVQQTVVKLGFTEDKVTVKESEGKVQVCVSITHRIARPLNFIIIHDAITAGMRNMYILNTLQCKIN